MIPIRKVALVRNPRNPRLDPKPGDALRTIPGPDTEVRCITAVKGRVWYKLFGQRHEYCVTLNDWRNWALNTRVVRAAD